MYTNILIKLLIIIFQNHLTFIYKNQIKKIRIWNLGITFKIFILYERRYKII